MATGEELKPEHNRVDLRKAIPVRKKYAFPEHVDICEFLMVDRKDPRVFYCKLAREQIDVAFEPCLLHLEDRIELCQFYRKHYVEKAMFKAGGGGA
jgi:hypothetical protein